jgi:hypothetical protein
MISALIAVSVLGLVALPVRTFDWSSKIENIEARIDVDYAVGRMTHI